MEQVSRMDEISDNFDPIRKDPEFIRFMAEMKTRWEGYQVEFR